MSQTTNNTGLQLIESFDGLRLNSYQDSVGVWTIGYGHTKGVNQGQTITQLGVAEAAVNRLGLTLSDNQFAALVSFTLNLGSGNLNKLRKNGLGAVPDRILLFDHAAAGALPRLTRRRTPSGRFISHFETTGVRRSHRKPRPHSSRPKGVSQCLVYRFLTSQSA